MHTALLKTAAATLLGLAASLTLGACEDRPADTAKSDAVVPAPAPVPAKPNPGEAPKLLIGVIAKSTSNPVFIAARTGATDAAKDLSKKYNREIVMRWETPVSEDAQKQAQAIEQLVSLGADGISISCTDGELLATSINDAVDKGVTVVTFDSDSPKSKRMAYYGINDVECGKAVMRELARAMGDQGGVVAILSGSQTAPNLNARIQGVKEELETLKDKGFTFKQVFYTKETANDAAALVQQVQTANPDIAGWAMVGGWPLFTKNALDNVSAKVVSVDTLPQQLEYVKSGKVQALVGQQCYGWGYESVRMLVEKLIEGKDPPAVINNFDLAIVTPENVTEYEGVWEKWLGNK
jgi:ribose transport system substrate-binding protein